MNDFFKQRLEGLAASTAENYLRGYSSMFEGLREKNITISDSINKAYFNEKVAFVKATFAQKETRVDRAIENPDQVIKSLYKMNYESGVIAETLNALGVRISEGYELIANYQKYIGDNEVSNLVGKGNHIYAAKEISSSLVQRISQVKEIPEQDVFRRHLKSVTDGEHTPHDFRYTYAERLFQQKLTQGTEYVKAMREVSIELNHTREEMTTYYLSGA